MLSGGNALEAAAAAPRAPRADGAAGARAADRAPATATGDRGGPRRGRRARRRRRRPRRRGRAGRRRRRCRRARRRRVRADRRAAARRASPRAAGAQRHRERGRRRSSCARRGRRPRAPTPALVRLVARGRGASARRSCGSPTATRPSCCRSRCSWRAPPGRSAATRCARSRCSSWPRRARSSSRRRSRFMGGVSRAARRGIIVKGATALEQLGRARTVLLDKTGTLTRGAPRVEDVARSTASPPDDVLAPRGLGRPAVAARRSPRRSCDAATQRGLRLDVPTARRGAPGGGHRRRRRGPRVVVGSSAWLRERGVDTSPARRAAERPVSVAPAARGSSSGSTAGSRASS